jgi:hypothetical protein
MILLLKWKVLPLRGLTKHSAHQAFSQKGVQASWDAPRTKNGRLWMPKFWGKREIIFNYFPRYINISEMK